MNVELRYDNTRPPLRPSMGHTAARLSPSRGRPARTSCWRTSSRSRPQVEEVATSFTRGRPGRFVDRRSPPARATGTRSPSSTWPATVASRTVGLEPSTGIFAPGDGAVVKSRRSSPGPPSRGAVLQPPAVAGQGEAPDDVGTGPEARAPAALDVEGARHSLVNGPYKPYVWAAFGTTAKPGTASSSARSGSSSSAAEKRLNAPTGRGRGGPVLGNRHRDGAMDIWRRGAVARASARWARMPSSWQSTRAAPGVSRAPAPRRRVHGVRGRLDGARARPQSPTPPTS